MENITEGIYEGCKSRAFTLYGNYTYVVEPKESAPGKPWVWRAEYFGAFPAVDNELLKRGWHLCYHGMGDVQFDKVTPGLKRFYNFAVQELGLSDKPVMFGFSRGGLYAYDYAVTYPDDLKAVYFDCPVLEVNSLPLWPCGKYDKCFSAGDADWAKRRTTYGLLDDDKADTFDKNPADTFEKYASINIPTLLMAGGADTTTPPTDNCARLAYHMQGKRFCYIVKPGMGHHPHSAVNDAQLKEAVDFLLGV